MNINGSVARIIISSLCCLSILFNLAYNLLFANPINKKFLINESAKMDYSLENGSVSGKENNPAINSMQNIDTTTSVAPETSNESLEVSTDTTVVGKVTENFLSPYTANTSYNNVYIKNSTGLSIDIKSLLSEPLGFSIEKNDQPQVLILHTHATESFLSETKNYYTKSDLSRNTDENYNIISVGNILADKLNSNGIKTIHDKTLHDYPSYNESYSRAAKTIKTYKQKYPSIKIVIDLHRDAISANDTDKVKVTTEISGKKAAQIMLVMGSQSGSVTNFPNWKENLKLAVRLQQTIEIMYPTLARSLSLMSRNYNESLTTGSMLIEIGTDGNSLEEVKYSAELLGNSLVSLLNTI